MSNSQAEGSSAHYRERAAESRARAEESKNPEVRRQLLEVAATYDRLAKYAAQREAS